MDRVEQLVRDSLRTRAEDVEPTPHLYRGVQDRIARRRRRTIATWVPAGAVALGVAVVLPSVLDTGTQVPSIEDYADGPVSAAPTSTRAVTVDRDGVVALVDLTDGSVLHEYGSLDGAGVPPLLDVAPTDVDAVPDAIAGTPQDRVDGPTLAITAFTVTCPPGSACAGETTTSFEPEGGAPEVGARFAVSPDGAWTATLAGPMQDADGWTLQLRPTPRSDAPELFREPAVVVPAGSVVQDWSGTLEPDGTSEVTVVTPDGQLLGFPLTYDGDTFTWTDEAVLSPVDREPVAAYASSHLGDGTGYVLSTGDAGLEVQAVRGGRTLGAVDVDALVGDPQAETVALDAWGDTATLSSPDGSWLLTHDGQGDFADPVALPDGTVRAALVGREVDDGPDDASPDEPGEASPAEPGEGLDDVIVEEPTAAFAGPIVQAGARSVVLRTDAEERILLALPPEGESTVVEVGVRPGSSADDLTAVVATTAEGFTDLRWVEVVDGQVQDPVVLEGAYASAGVGDASVTLRGLTWSPAGDRLLWVEATPGDATLRAIGWDDGPGTGDTATDNVALGLPTGLDGSLVDVVDAGGGRLVARFTSTGGAWSRWVLEVQGDGALAVPGTEAEPVPSPVGGAVVALTGADDESRPTWLLIAAADGPRLVRDPFTTAERVALPDLASGDGLTAARLSEVDGGVLVQTAGLAWSVGADGQVTGLGDAVDVDPVR
jgi:hypothetical protein